MTPKEKQNKKPTIIWAVGVPTNKNIGHDASNFL